MAADSFSEVTSESWFGRIGGAFKGIVIGLVLFVVAFPVLFWNEGRAVETYKTLKEGGGAVVSVTADNVDPANEGKLIHLTGAAETEATLTDPIFGVTAPALKLRRSVEMYQWDESSQSKTKKKLGGGTETKTTYSYSRDWSSRLIRSSDFKEPTGHQNPGSFPYEAKTWVADHITVGAFDLSPSLVAMIGNFESLPVPAETTLPESMQGVVAVHAGGFYVGEASTSPQIGDARVRFEIARPAAASIMAQQAGNSFTPYLAKAGGKIELLVDGVQSAELMIEAEQASNRMLTWILRGGAFLVMFIGLTMVFRPLSVLADVLPILGSIISFGTGIVAFLIAAILSLVTIAIAWIVYRPLLGIALIVVAGGLAFAMKGKLKGAAPKSE